MEKHSAINFKKLCDICRVESRLFDFLYSHKLLIDFTEKCEHCEIGTVHLVTDNRRPDNYIWRCDNRNCSDQHTIHKYSFFSGSKLSLEQILKIVYYWTHKYSQELVIQETKLSNHTVIDFYNFCREVCSIVTEKQSEQIGGPGKVLEIDESKFGKRKYNHGKRVLGVWVFGGIEWDSNPSKCFFVTVEDRSTATLIPINKRWILPGTTIASDCWKAYSSLQQEGYIHTTINHSIQFVSETGTHTNNTESRWNSLKKSLPKFGTQKHFYNCYFAEYCIRTKFLQSPSSDKFLDFVN